MPNHSLHFQESDPCVPYSNFSSHSSLGWACPPQIFRYLFHWLKWSLAKLKKSHEVSAFNFDLKGAKSMIFSTNRVNKKRELYSNCRHKKRSLLCRDMTNHRKTFILNILCLYTLVIHSPMIAYIPNKCV